MSSVTVVAGGLAGLGAYTEPTWAVHSIKEAEARLHIIELFSLSWLVDVRFNDGISMAVLV